MKRNNACVLCDIKTDILSKSARVCFYFIWKYALCSTDIVRYGLILTSLLKILEKRIFVVFFETKRRKKLVSNSLLTSTVRTS